MARIRTIKPEFFTSEDIVSLSPMARLLYIALWCEADREGRMSWKPKTFKMRYFPGDNCNIDELCAELIGAGLLELYGEGLAYIPCFAKHQHVNPREAASTLPEPTDVARAVTRQPRVSDAQVGREGREGEGKGRKDIPAEPAAPPDDLPPSPVQPARKSKPEKSAAPTAQTWEAYAAAYENRYSMSPLRDATANGMLARFVGRVGGDDAPGIAAFYVGLQTQIYVKAMHPISMLLRDAEALRTQWGTGRAAPDVANRLTSAEIRAGQFATGLVPKHPQQISIDKEIIDAPTRTLG